MSKRKHTTKDRDSEQFWKDQNFITSIAKMKASNCKLQAKKIQQEIDTPISLTKINTTLQKFFYDNNTDQLFLRAQTCKENSRKCLTESELRQLVARSHIKDHRKGVTIYQDLRQFYYPMNRKYILQITKEYISNYCEKCRSVKQRDTLLPKRSKSVTATYPNSRWQIDLKKMPNHKGFHRVLNVIDVYSRFAFGAALKSKKVCKVTFI